MATRSTIAIEHENGTVDQIYCHWDGYLEHNGQMLIHYWQDRYKIEQMIQLGNMSSLGTEIGSKHDFDNPHRGECNFYGRDRGEGGVAAKRFKSFEDYEQNHSYEEYEYIFRADGQWYVSQHTRDYEPLEDAIMEQMRAEA